MLRTVLGKILQPALVLLALGAFAWFAAGILVRQPSTMAPVKPGQAQAEVTKPDTLAPQLSKRDVDSYAVYESKDPFRELLKPAGGGGTGGSTTTSPGGSTGRNTPQDGRPPSGGSTYPDSGIIGPPGPNGTTGPGGAPDQYGSGQYNPPPQGDMPPGQLYDSGGDLPPKPSQSGAPAVPSQGAGGQPGYSGSGSGSGNGASGVSDAPAPSGSTAAGPSTSTSSGSLWAAETLFKGSTVRFYENGGDSWVQLKFGGVTYESLKAGSTVAGVRVLKVNVAQRIVILANEEETMVLAF